MPTPFPTPSEAATARANSGFFSNVGSNLLHHSPYLGPAYNVGGTITHLINGTAGQYGPAPTLLGKLLSLFSGNPTNAPRAIPVDPSQIGGTPSNANPQGPVDPNDPNNPLNNNGSPAAPAPPPADRLGPGGIPMNVWQQVYNTGRFTNAPAFFPTLSQTQFPGSAIGPIGATTANPYVNTGLGAAPQGSPQGIPGWASAFSSYIAKNNIP